MIIVVDDAQSAIILQVKTCEIENVVHIILFTGVPRRNHGRRIGNERDRKILRDVNDDQVDSQMILILAPLRYFVLAATSKLQKEENRVRLYEIN